MGRGRKRRPGTSSASHIDDGEERSGLFRHVDHAEAKIRLIGRCLEQDPVDVVSLKRLAVSRGGLMTNDMRRRAWPKLVGTSVFHSPELPSDEEMREHKYYGQVQMDIQRCYKRFPPDMRKARCREFHQQLSQVIMSCLCLSPHAHYYQGFHDIAILWVMVVGPDAALIVLLQLAKCHLMDFMDVDMRRTTSMLTFVHDIIGSRDPTLKQYLARAEIDTVFCLSWNITWLSHVVEHTPSVVRLHDLFLASHCLMPMYLSAAIVLWRREEVLSCECEMPSVHHLLSSMPQSLPLEQLITDAISLYHDFPPSNFGSHRASQCHAYNGYEAFTEKLWRQPSDTHLSKAMWRELERQQKERERREKLEGEVRRGEPGVTFGSLPNSEKRFVLRSTRSNGGDVGGGDGGTSLLGQAKQLAVVGISASVGVASIVLWAAAKETLF